MSKSSHIIELQRKHENLSDQVEKIQSRPSTDPLQVVTLKKQKLKIKEQIERLTL